MHGLGNDFVVIDARSSGGDPDPSAGPCPRGSAPRRRLRSVRRDPPPDAGRHRRQVDFRNPDGTPADACGNATRCVARLLMEETGAEAVAPDRLRRAARRGAGGGLVPGGHGAAAARLARGAAGAARWTSTRCRWRASPGRSRAWATRTASSSWLTSMRWRGTGRAGRARPAFPERTNVEFVQVIDRDHVRMRVWERGAGIPAACGSGACAAVVVTARRRAGRAAGGRAAGRRQPRRSTGARTGSPDDRAGGAGLRGLTLLAGVPSRRWCRMSTGLHHLRLPADAYETEVMREKADAAGVGDAVIVNTCAVTSEAVRQARQAIRKARRNQSRRPHHRDRLRRPDRPGLRGHAGSRPGARQRREAEAGGLGAASSSGPGASWSTTSWRTGDAGAADRRARHAGARLRAGAERLRPPLHLLHHSLRPRQLAQRRRRRRWSSRSPGWSVAASTRWC